MDRARQEKSVAEDKEISAMQPNHQSSTQKESKNIASRYEPLKQTIHPKQKRSYEMIENNSTNIVQTIVVVLVIAVAALAGMTSLAM
ncbi:MAG TPA: hypothetical protein VIS10_07645, partial [Anaerolineales bacterium]